MSDEPILIYGTTWCGDCRRARRFFNQHHIPYRWIDIDQDRQAEQIVRKANNGNRSVPTIFYPDGTVLVEPSTATLSAKLAAARSG
jgi:mycoredoxin